MLKRIHLRLCGSQAPWWREPGAAAEEGVRGDEGVDSEAYRSGRKHYIQEGKGTPPAGAEE